MHISNSAPTLSFRLNVKIGVDWQRGFGEENLFSMVKERRRQKTTTADDDNGQEGHSIRPPKVVGTLRAQLLPQFYADSFEIVQVSWSLLVVWI